MFFPHHFSNGWHHSRQHHPFISSSPSPPPPPPPLLWHCQRGGRHAMGRVRAATTLSFPSGEGCVMHHHHHHSHLPYVCICLIHIIIILYDIYTYIYVWYAYIYVYIYVYIHLYIYIYCLSTIHIIKKHTFCSPGFLLKLAPTWYIYMIYIYILYNNTYDFKNTHLLPQHFCKTCGQHGIYICMF